MPKLYLSIILFTKPVFSLVMFSLFQVVLSFEHGVWAPNLHYNTPNPDIPALEDGRLQVVTKPTPIKGHLAGINSFGFGGSNAHVILRANRNKSLPPEAPNLPRLLQFCGRTQEAVETLIEQSCKMQEHTAYLSMLNDISGVSVSSMPYRGYTLIGSESDIKEVQIAQASGRPLWYICSGNCSNCFFFFSSSVQSQTALKLLGSPSYMRC